VSGISKSRSGRSDEAEVTAAAFEMAEEVAAAAEAHATAVAVFEMAEVAAVKNAEVTATVVVMTEVTAAAVKAEVAGVMKQGDICSICDGRGGGRSSSSKGRSGRSDEAEVTAAAF
jgi:hypothetical protein